MNDLHTINKLNAEAVERDDAKRQPEDKYVVSEYAGLNYVGFTAHATEAEANAKALEIHQHPGKRASVAGPRKVVDQTL